MNVLLVGMSNRNFLPDLQHNLRKQNITADLIDLLEGYFIDSDGVQTHFGKKIVSKNFLTKNLQLYLNFSKAFTLLSKNKGAYDICNIHFMDVRYFFFKRKLAKLSQKLVISIYGSDFYKYRKFSFLQKPFYRKAKRITFSNDATLEAFDAFYQKQFHDKLHSSRFGLTNVDLISKHYEKTRDKTISKTYFNLPDDKIFITIGYNTSPNNQHTKIIAELNKLNDNLKQKIFLIFPMTYGGFADNKEEVEKLLIDSGFPHLILTDYLNTDAIIHLRIVSDILIHLPIRDQLSATMLEYMYTGSYVITGQWLPYDMLDKEEIFYKRIASFDELPSEIENYFSYTQSIKEKLVRNEPILLHFSSWDVIIKKWLAAYNL
ncbi:MAG: glycosyltransferase [Bacteroidota bacterium]